MSTFRKAVQNLLHDQSMFFGLKSMSIMHYSYVKGVLVLYTASSPNQNYTSKRQNDLADHKMITIVTVMIITPVPVITVQLLSRLTAHSPGIVLELH